MRKQRVLDELNILCNKILRPATKFRDSRLISFGDDRTEVDNVIMSLKSDVIEFKNSENFSNKVEIRYEDINSLDYEWHSEAGSNLSILTSDVEYSIFISKVSVGYLSGVGLTENRIGFDEDFKLLDSNCYWEVESEDKGYFSNNFAVIHENSRTEGLELYELKPGEKFLGGVYPEISTCTILAKKANVSKTSVFRTVILQSKEFSVVQEVVTYDFEGGFVKLSNYWRVACPFHRH